MEEYLGQQNNRPIIVPVMGSVEVDMPSYTWEDLDDMSGWPIII